MNTGAAVNRRLTTPADSPCGTQEQRPRVDAADLAGQEEPGPVAGAADD